MPDRRTLTRADLAIAGYRIEPWIANEIWHVLVEECGACWSDVNKRHGTGPGWIEHYCFIAYLDSDGGGFSHEYRFMGALGFGGKFYNDGIRWRVGCYREDDTPARSEMIRRANERLAELRARVNGETPDA